MHISGLIFEFDLVLLLAEFRISYLVCRIQKVVTRSVRVYVWNYFLN